MADEFSSTTTSTNKTECCEDVDLAAFRRLVSKRAKTILSLCACLERMNMGTDILTRPLLGMIFSEAAQLQELLDSYRSRNNSSWAQFRHLISNLKLFDDLGYKLRHIEHSIPAYNLLEVKEDFAAGTKQTLEFVSNVIQLIAARLMLEAKKLELPIPKAMEVDDFSEDLPEGYLPHDRKARHVISASETVANLSTAFLNQFAESEVLKNCYLLSPERLKEKIPDPVSEESLRRLQQKFHNLQSLYDTYISDTDTEELDSDLPVLRGHISVIFHLLEIATHLAHYYERHVYIDFGIEDCRRPTVNPETLLEVLSGYALLFSGRYLERARDLCQEMLKRYAKMGCVVLPVPSYRGFHVRPSTLISKIIRHYGSRVTMTMNQMVYDAINPLDLFRANEAINAEKRRRLAEEICAMELDFASGMERREAVGMVVNKLATMGKIVIYQSPLPLDDLCPREEDSLTQTCVDEIARLLAMGKIDIQSEINVSFCGDTRVLEDIRLLAQSGYGEDAYGNNIPLPAKLRYLRS